MGIASIDIQADIVRILAQKDDALATFPVPSKSTAAGTATTVKDRRLGLGTGTAGKYNGRILKMTEDVAGAFTTAATVDGAHNATVTTLAVSDAASILPGYVIVLDSSEKVLVTGKATNNLTVVRGHWGTTAASYSGGESVEFAYLGYVVGVDDDGFDLTDTLTTSPAFGGVPPVDLEYLMYPKGLAPETVVSAMNRVLRATETFHLWAPSLVDDADFEEEDLTNWAEVGSPDTREFVTTAALVRLGARSLHLDSASVGDGAVSNSFSVHELENLLIAVHVSVTKGDMRVTLYNVTASENIEQSGTLDDDAWAEVRFTKAVPADCELASLRFLAQATADSGFYISPHIIVQSDRQRAYTPPSWLVSRRQIVDARYLPAGADAEAEDAYVSLGEGFRSALGLDVIRSDRDVTPFRVLLTNPLSYGPVYLLCQRSLPTLSYDTETTVCDLEYLVQKAVSLILKDRNDSEWHRYAGRAAERAHEMGYGLDELHTEQAMTTV